MKTVDSLERIKLISVEAHIAEQDSLMSDQFRKLRSVLNIHYMANDLRSILVTSYAPDEGKTTVSLNLSAALAKSPDTSVILIDADVRKKSTSARLGLEDNPGLSEILDDKADFEEVMVQTEIEGLNILPAGNDSANSVELTSSIRMKDLLQQLRQRYQNSYIIIDSAPLIVASETTAISHIVDGVIIVIMADSTRRDVVKREIESTNKRKIVGVVLNAADFETSYHYQDYYRKYYKKETNWPT